MTFCLAPNSWSLTWSRHFLFGDNHDILGICWSKPTKCAFFLALSALVVCVLLEPLARIAFLPWLSWWLLTENVTTKWLTKSWSYTMSPSTVAPTVSVSPLIITVELVTLTWFCFSWNFSWLCQWHFVALITVRKKVMTKWVTKRWSQKCHEACIGQNNRFEYHLWLSQLSTWRFEYHLWLSQLSTWRWYGFCFNPIFLWHWKWHFPALAMTITKALLLWPILPQCFDVSRFCLHTSVLSEVF